MDLQSDRRRRAFIEFLASRHLTRGGLTRETGISPNIVYNFLNGKSHYLSQPTLEKISAHYAVPIAVLTGEETSVKTSRRSSGLSENRQEPIDVPFTNLPTGLVPLKVQGTIMGPGVWMESLFSPCETPSEILLPVARLYAETSFALMLSPSGSHTLLPAGAILGCVAIKDYLQRPMTNDLVIAVQRNRIGLFECSVRRYQVEGNRHFLVSDTRKTSRHHKVELQAPLNDPAALGFQDMFMHSIVLSYTANLPASSR